MIVLTTEQMVKMTAIDGRFDSEVRTRGSYVFPQKYEYLRPLFECEQYAAYWSTGFNFYSPTVNEIDFGYIYHMGKSKIRNEIKSWFAAKTYFVRLEWNALRNAYKLARYNQEVYIPTVQEIQQAFFEDFDRGIVHEIKESFPEEGAVTRVRLDISI